MPVLRTQFLTFTPHLLAGETESPWDATSITSHVRKTPKGFRTEREPRRTASYSLAEEVTRARSWNIRKGVGKSPMWASGETWAEYEENRWVDQAQPIHRALHGRHLSFVLKKKFVQQHCCKRFGESEVRATTGGQSWSSKGIRSRDEMRKNRDVTEGERCQRVWDSNIWLPVLMGSGSQVSMYSTILSSNNYSHTSYS